MYDRIDPDWKLGPDDMEKVSEEERAKRVSRPRLHGEKSVFQRVKLGVKITRRRTKS